MNRNIKIPLRIFNIEKLISKVNSWKISDEDKRDLLLYFKDVEIGKVTGNIMKAGTLSVYILNLKIGLESLNKPTGSLKEADIDKLCEDLLKDNLRWIRKKKDDKGNIVIERRGYADSRKDKIKDGLINYFDWKLGDKATIFIKTLKVRPKAKETTPD